MFTTLISANDLQTLLQSGQPCKIYDCSFDLMQSEAGDLQYAQAHMAGSVRADLERHLSSAKGAPDAASGGRHPLPSRQQVANWVARTGLRPGMQAVVYDCQGNNYCGRLWWMLKWLGHDAVAVLDGGLGAWQAVGGAMAEGAAVESQNNDEKYPLGLALVGLVATIDVVGELNQASQTIVDARGAPRYRGEVEPLDPIAGHIPGALNRPFTQNFEADGTFKSAQQLRQEFTTLLDGRDPASVVHHCGSGVSAVPNLMAMEIAGLGPTRLYAGSWSEWSRTPGLPCAKG